MAALARGAARELVTLNEVLGEPRLLSDSDVVLGRAIHDEATNSYSFTPSNQLPDAVRVTVRLTHDSPNGPLELAFAGIFGRATTDVSATATAVMAPRDLALVSDLSASHNDDSELRNYQLTEINMHEMWDGLPGGIDDADGGL